jgi:hypothetical protein
VVHYFTRLFHPEVFQGRHKKRNYFEGWYLKLINRDNNRSMAVIPGVSLGNAPEERHAFIQIIDGQTCHVDSFRFSFKEFRADKSRFAVSIGDSYFSDTQMRLRIDQDGRRLAGDFSFLGIRKLKRSLFSPGIMGPFSFVPGMECYHGIVNVHHEIEGELAIDGETLDYSGGHGYIEKDWGRSFPESWIWLQCNYFAEPDVSLMFSLAKIPLLGTRFLGMISFLRLGDQEYRFATYTRARLRHCSYAHDTLNVVIEDRRHRLTIRAVHGPAGLLAAPKNGMMTSTVLESISATVEVSLAYLNGQHIYVGQGTNAGMEFVEGILKN